MISSKMHIETTDRELLFSREFEAPRELVFDAFSDCKHLRNWWGPEQWPVSSCEMDFREGGNWFYCMQGPDGQLACGRAVYRRIERPTLIVYEDYFVDENGNVNEELPNGLMTFEFADQGALTKVTGSAQYPQPSDLQTVLEMGVVEGMTETLDRLEEHLAQLGQGEG